MPAPVSLSLFRVPITRPAHLRPLRLKHADDVRQPGHQNRVVQTLSNERTKRLNPGQTRCSRERPLAGRLCSFWLSAGADRGIGSRQAGLALAQ